MAWTVNEDGVIVSAEFGGGKKTARDTFMSTVSSADEKIEGLRWAAKANSVEIDRLLKLQAGVIDEMASPAKKAMDTYVQARTEFYKATQSGTGTFKYTFRNNITHGTGMNMSLPLQYGAHTQGGGGDLFVSINKKLPSLKTWAIEQYGADGAYEQTMETWPERFPGGVITSKIVEMNGTHIHGIPAGQEDEWADQLSLSANDYDFAMGWLHHSPKIDIAAGGGSTSFIAPGSSHTSVYGINFQLESVGQSTAHHADLISHYEDISELSSRYKINDDDPVIVIDDPL